MGAEQSEMKRWHEIPAGDVLNVHVPNNNELVILRKVFKVILKHSHVVDPVFRVASKPTKFVKPMRMATR